jgi:predicted acylesterase/phospholipase RssA
VLPHHLKSQRDRSQALGVESECFDNLVFAGGGNRCFWQAGFWSVAAETMQPRLTRIAAVSAGAAVSCALFSDTFEDGFASYKRALASNRRNIYVSNLLRRRPVFPHGHIYRETLLASISMAALTQLRQGPDVQILVARPPYWASHNMALLLGVLALGVDAFQANEVHPSGGHRVGFRPMFVSVRQCHTPEDLTDLIIASSCVPPLTPQVRRNGQALLDGGLVSNVPIGGIEPATGNTLVLLTRQYRKLPTVAGRTYVQPSKPIPVAAWDYTNADAVQSAFDLGRWDGEMFCKGIGA